jgi:hypothetical protein
MKDEIRYNIKDSSITIKGEIADYISFGILLFSLYVMIRSIFTA